MLLNKELKNTIHDFFIKNINLVITLIIGFKSLLKMLYNVICLYRNKKINFNIKDFNKSLIDTLQVLHKNKYYNYIDFITAILFTIGYIHGIKTKLLKNGNLKLNKKIKIFDLPSIITCKMACKDCYAIKSERIYQNTRVMRLYHLLLLNYAFNNKNFYKELLQDFNKELKNTNIMRWHGSGDIFNSKYLFFILQVVNNNKHVQFYTYSKMLDNNQIDFINNTYNNFNIIKSLINDKYINYGNDEYLQKLKNDNKDIKFYTCKYNEDNIKEHGTCMGKCKQCLHNSNILFHIH